MPNRLKIVGELADRATALHRDGLAPSAIGRAISASTAAVLSFLRRSGLSPNVRREAIRTKDYEGFVALVGSGVPWTVARKRLGVSIEKARELLEARGIVPTGHAEAGVGRRLSPSEAEARIGIPGVRHDGFDAERKTHRFLMPDGRGFEKGSGKMYQGVPFGKSGRPLSPDEFVSRMTAAGYTLLSEFRGVSEHVSVVCPRGHTRYARAERILKQGCEGCGLHGTSVEEQEVLAWVRQFFPSAVSRYSLPKESPRPGRPLEVDIYVPERGLGIEYCGAYYHSVPSASVADGLAERQRDADEQKHYRKMLAANAAGMRLITIFSWEWKGRGDQVRAYLRSALGANTVRLNARDCEVVEVPGPEASAFLDLHHIQGTDRSRIFALGLRHGGELVGVMTAGTHPNRGSSPSEEQYLTRLCFRSGTTVRGGATRLLSALAAASRGAGKSRIVSWSDNRWSDGGAYVKMGFALERPRHSDGRKMGLSDGSIWPEKYGIRGGKPLRMSVVNRMLRAGADPSEFRYLWDCGKKRWVYGL